MSLREACGALLAALLALPAAAQGPAHVPQPPYFSIQLGSAPDRAQALALLQPHAQEQAIRAEQRSGGWQIRVGAWTQRLEAEQALQAFQARGVPDARILSMRTAVPWLLPDGTTLPLASSRTTPAAAAPAAAASRPPATAVTFIPTPPLPVARPVSTRLKPSVEFRATAARLDLEIRRWLDAGGAQRRDGFLYGMDLAQALLYAAERGDLALYQKLRPAAARVIVTAGDAYAQGFVLWRVKDDVPPEVSGAAETALMARALLAGAAAFNRAEDASLARKVLDGYARHAFELQTFWLVRKYFSFPSRTFANLSMVSNYQADLFAQAERATPGRQEWSGFGERSYALLERAASPSTLLYPLVQPEVAVTYPGLRLEVYGPNGMVPLEDSCAAAEGAVRGRPKLAARVLDFATARGHRNRYGRIYAYFDGRDGEPVGEDALSSTGYACLGQLAAALDDTGAWKLIEPQLLEDMRPVATLAASQAAPLYAAAPMLRAAYAAGAFN